MKKILNQGLLMLLMLFVFVSNIFADNQYGLKDKIQDGVILHCFDWKLSDIQAEIQTSQRPDSQPCRPRPFTRESLWAQHGT